MDDVMAGHDRFYYFAYGSNLLRERLATNNPSAAFKAVAKLMDYQLVFVGQSSNWKGAIASIKCTEGSEVWGVVWLMDIRDLPSLNEQEKRYTPREVTVTDSKGEQFLCRSFQHPLSDSEEALNPPSPHYKDVIVRGARQNQIPEHYLRFLEGIHDNGCQEEVAVYNVVMKALHG